MVNIMPGPDLIGAAKARSDVDLNQKRNELLDVKLKEFQSPLQTELRDKKAKSDISALERESVVLGARELKNYFDAADAAKTPQERLKIISDTLDFLDKRAENIVARGGDPEDTITAKNALENYIHNPTMGAEGLAAVVNTTNQIAEADVTGGEDRVRKTFVDSKGFVNNVFASGRVVNTGIQSERPDFKYHVIDSVDENGNNVKRIFRKDPTNRPNADGTLSTEERYIPVETNDPQGLLSRIPPENITYESTGANQQPTVTQTEDVTTVTSPVEGIAAQEGAKEGAKLNEQRFSKIVNDAPQHTKMAGFIRQVSESVLRASDKIKNIIKDNPNTAIGLGSQFSVQRTAEGGTKQVNWPGSWDEPAIQVDTLINQMFGGAAFATLQQMRQASPTGGALGQVSNFEINLLQNQWAAFSQRAGDSKFAIGQMDEMMEQAQLVSDLANVEIGVQQRIQALGPDATKEQIAELINAGFKNMADVYKRHERDSGSWDNDTLTWTPSEKTVAGEDNEGKKDALDLTNQTITTQEQYDALPSEAIYTGKDGKTYRKP